MNKEEINKQIRKINENIQEINILKSTQTEEFYINSLQNSLALLNNYKLLLLQLNSLIPTDKPVGLSNNP